MKGAVFICLLCTFVQLGCSQSSVPFGKDMRSQFYFNEGLVFLNHGSFGATPKQLLHQEFEYQIKMERNTMNWMNRERVPLLNECRRQIAEYSNARTEDVVMVVDATSAINAVFRSLQFEKGDKILYLSTVYGAVHKMFQVIKAVHDVELIEVVIPFPLTSDQQVINVIKQQFILHGSSIRIALYSHITSPTALILPVKELTQLSHSYNTQVFIDGAHSLGQIPVNITDIDADYYTSDIHKWLCGPKGAGILWTKQIHHDYIVPTSISSGAGGGYIPSFEWTGTLDFSAYLSTMNALTWRQSIGGDEVVSVSYMTDLCDRAGHLVAHIWGTEYPSIAPASMFASMSVVELPQSAYSMSQQVLQDQLYQQYQIEVVLFTLNSKYYTRMSCHVYNYDEEYVFYANAVVTLTTQAVLSNPQSTLAEIEAAHALQAHAKLVSAKYVKE